MKLIIAVLITRLTSLAFAMLGVYALQCGFFKTGGCLIASGIVSLLFVQINIREKNSESDFIKE